MTTLSIGEQIVENNVVDLDYPVCKAVISGDTSFTFKNIGNGKKTTVAVRNSDSSAHAVIFIGAGMNPSDEVKTIAGETYTLYTVTCSANGAFVCICSENSGTPIPSGGDGDLTILSGETVTIPAGVVYDYDNIDIKAGGTLVVDDVNDEADLTEIYANTFRIYGQILGRTLGLTSSFTKNYVTTLHDELEVSFAPKLGGAGGHGGAQSASGYLAGGLGGDGSNRGGGGGGGGSQYQSVGGAGGTNGGSGSAGVGGGAGGAGDVIGNGLDGDSVGNADGGAGDSGGGGGGDYSGGTRYTGGGAGSGSNGKHGVPLYLYCKSEIKGAGIIDLSGNTGFYGGNGGDGTGTSGGGGGGGGGGAGGSGGALFIKSRGFSVSYNIGGGSGGAGGSGGTSTEPTESGYAGESGNNGTFTEL